MYEFRTIADLLEIGIRVERCLLDYYKRMRDHIQHRYDKDQFNTLAAAEQAHIVMLRRFLESCSDDEEKFSLSSDQSISQNSLVSHAMRIFSRAGEVSTVEDGVSALSIGTELETESMFFFSELRNLFLGEQHDLINRILNDEKAHLLKLIAMTKKATD